MPPSPWGWNTRSSRTVSRSAWPTAWRRRATCSSASPSTWCSWTWDLPDGSGYALCKEIRAAGDTPIIILSARDEEASIVLGLDLGADDYLTKPFRLRELISRMKAVLRRRGPVEAADRTLTCGDVTVFAQQAKVYKNGREVLLTALEYRLLLTLILNQGRVLTRSQILGSIWDVDEDFVNDNTLTVYIKRLREKLEDDPQNPALIKTVRGLGYQAGD